MEDIKIIEYEEKYLEDVKDLLVELEEYILTIDEDHLDQLHKDYRELMAINDLNEVKENEGKCFIAVKDNKAIGVIMGTIPPYDEYDYLDYKCPRRGEITELVVSKKVRSSGIGQKLIKQMEDYFKSVGCEYVIVDIFAYNDNAMKFYFKDGFHPRMVTGIKKI
jgi:ribosomal protein S18 acetylase RimI-like enzyme